MELSDEELSSFKIFSEVLSNKNLRNAALLIIIYGIAGILFVGFLSTLYISLILRIGPMVWWILFLVSLLVLYFLMIGGFFLNSIFYYLILNPSIDLKAATEKLLKLGKKWLVSPYIFLVSSVHSLKFFIQHYGASKVFLPTKTSFSISEWSIQRISLLFPLMAMKGMDVHEATEELIKFQIEYSEFFLKRRIQYKFLLPILLVIIFFGSIIGGLYLSSFFLYLFKISPENELYGRILAIGFVFFPLALLIFLLFLFYGTRGVVYAKLYARNTTQEELTWERLKEKWRKSFV